MEFFELIIGMIFILLTAMVFCNALEHLGEKIGISEGVTGSIFVAVGTALPETIVPIIALFAGGTAGGQMAEFGNEIGIGAILGPPLMLSTLSITLMALSVLKKRGWHGQIRPERSGLVRDLKFFSFGYTLAILLAFSHNFYHNHVVDVFVVAILLLSYFFYVMLTIRASKSLVEAGHATEAEDELFLTHYLKIPNNLISVAAQAIIGLIGLIYFAHVFINGISGTSKLLGIPAFIISVVLIPIATELPEKVNSILWIRKGKDTLAFGNITGAMVFQGLLLPVLGIALTSWELPWDKAITCIMTFFAVAWISSHIGKHKHFEVWHFMVNGVLYFLSLVLSIGIFV